MRMIQSSEKTINRLKCEDIFGEGEARGKFTNFDYSTNCCIAVTISSAFNSNSTGQICNHSLNDPAFTRSNVELDYGTSKLISVGQTRKLTVLLAPTPCE